MVWKRGWYEWLARSGTNWCGLHLMGHVVEDVAISVAMHCENMPARTLVKMFLIDGLHGIEAILGHQTKISKLVVHSRATLLACLITHGGGTFL